MAHTDLTVHGATSAGRWTSRLVPFAAVALITAQLVVARAKASTHSHLHITPAERAPAHALRTSKRPPCMAGATRRDRAHILADRHRRAAVAAVAAVATPCSALPGFS